MKTYLCKAYQHPDDHTPMLRFRCVALDEEDAEEMFRSRLQYLQLEAKKIVIEEQL